MKELQDRVTAAKNAACECDFTQARRLYTTLLDDVSASLGATDPTTLQVKGYLANVIASTDVESLDHAQRLYEEVVSGWDQTHGALHENAINARMNLAVLYKKRGKVTEAKDLIRSVLEPRRDADDNNTLVARVNLANILVKEGEHDKAIELLSAAHEAWSDRLGPTADRTLQCKVNLANACANSGDALTARRLYTSALEGWGETPTATSVPNFVLAQVNLAVLLFDDGDVHSARRLYGVAADRCDSLLGAAHPTTMHVQRFADVLGRPDQDGSRRDSSNSPRFKEGGEQPQDTRELLGVASPSTSPSPNGDLAAFVAEAIAEHGESPVIDSAIRVQASFRGFRARKEYKRKMRAIVLIQMWYRGYVKRRDLRQAHGLAPNALPGVDGDNLSDLIEDLIAEHEVETMAAVRIQTSFRGRLARQEMKQVRRRSQLSLASIPEAPLCPNTVPATSADGGEHPEDLGSYLSTLVDENGRDTLEMSAIRVQTSFRGFRARKEYKEHKARFIHAIVRIQAMYRGHIARKLQRGSRALRVERKAHDNTATTIEVAMDLCGGKLGFSIRETLVGPRMDGRGVAISRVIPGESADRTGILQVGMPLLAINGVQIPDRGPKGTKHAAVRMIKQAGASLVLTCGTDLAKPTLSMQTVAKIVGLSAASSPAAKPTPIPESDTPPRTSTRTPPHLSVPDY